MQIWTQVQHEIAEELVALPEQPVSDKRTRERTKKSYSSFCEHHQTQWNCVIRIELPVDHHRAVADAR